MAMKISMINFTITTLLAREGNNLHSEVRAGSHMWHHVPLSCLPNWIPPPHHQLECALLLLLLSCSLPRLLG